MILRGALGQKGITGLETAIVLIAFVVVASVFAFTILSAGVFSSEANKQTIHAGLKETRTGLRQHGSAFAFAGFAGSTQAVFKIVFIVSNSLAGEPVDLTAPTILAPTRTWLTGRPRRRSSLMSMKINGSAICHGQ
jgi:flagellin FlaB